MVKVLIILSAMIVMVGCGNKRTHTVYDKNYIPVNVVPAPPQNIKRPNLPVHSLTEEQLQDDGELVKAYKVSLHKLMGYTRGLELVYNKYNALSIDSNNLMDILQRYNASNPMTENEPFRMSAGFPDDDTIEVNEHMTPPDFDFEHEFQTWKTQKDFENIQEQINILNDTEYNLEDI